LEIAAERSRITIHRVRRYLPFLLVAGVLVVAVVAGFILFRYRVEPPALRPTTTASPTSITGPVFTYGQPGAEPMHVRGDPNAPVQLEEFGDFECLPCSIIWPVLGKMEQDYGKRLAVVFREHPLQMHRFALDAARAAEAAGLQGKFWEMHDTLYRNRGTWVPATYVRPYLNDYATELGLDLDRFKADIDGDEVAKRITADQDRGDSLGIDRTPVLYGEKVAPTAHNEKGLREVTDKALGARPQ
jgi:Thioredoxin